MGFAKGSTHPTGAAPHIPKNLAYRQIRPHLDTGHPLIDGLAGACTVPRRGKPMPIIRHRSGPLAGKEQTIDENVERITFGRDPSACDVVFPADLTLVARRHFAL